MGIGKWIGGVLGFMAFGPLGALAGIILGSFFEEGANMTGQSFGGGTNYDDYVEVLRRHKSEDVLKITLMRQGPDGYVEMTKDITVGAR